MRSFLTFVVLAGLGAAYLWQKQHEEKSAVAQPPAVTNHSTATSAATVSEHNWMKRSLDRASEVRDTARRQTQEAQQP